MKPTQRQRLRELFKSRPMQWIPLPEIADMRIMQYGRVISELRKIEKMDIPNRTEFKDGVQRSWFMWIPEAKVQKEMEFA